MLEQEQSTVQYSTVQYSTGPGTWAPHTTGTTDTMLEQEQNSDQKNPKGVLIRLAYLLIHTFVKVLKFAS